APALRGSSDVGVLLPPRRRREELDDRVRSVGEGLAHRLRTFEEEKPRLGPGTAFGQFGDGPDTRRSGILQHDISLRNATEIPGTTTGRPLAGGRPVNAVAYAADFGALTSEGRAFLAVSTSEAKVAGSFTASSASIRRSTCTPARPRPWMNRL
ncbi:hypothetical protein ABE10_00130, partial [Bacillus toyonensis]|nr:hypothetical protein [Bacillus toyonensis]